MKKLLMVFAMVGAFATSTFAADGGSAYKTNDAQVDQLFAGSEDITMAASNDLISQFGDAEMNAVMVGDGDKTKTGFLVRAFFCGMIGLHRSYMGTGGKKLIWYYLCLGIVPVACIDFWYVVFKGNAALDKYKDNPKWIVW